MLVLGLRCDPKGVAGREDRVLIEVPASAAGTEIEVVLVGEVSKCRARVGFKCARVVRITRASLIPEG